METGHPPNVETQIADVAICVKADAYRFPCLDLGELGALGMVVAGESFQFECGGFPIQVTFRPDSSVMEITHQIDGRLAKYNIPLVTTYPNRGGIRWFFSCPKCAKRCLKLYKRGNFFLCKQCQNLRHYNLAGRLGMRQFNAALRKEAESLQQQPGRENGNQQDQGTQGNVVLADT
jgi:hypothetical protein